MPEHIKIIPPKNNKLNEDDRLKMGTLLLKAGFTVKMGSEKSSGTTRYFVEFWEEE